MAFLNVNNIKLHYQDIGYGSKVVVFNHGLIMDNLSSWYFTLGSRVSTFSRAILYDIRGHGKSTRPTSGYTISNFLLDLYALTEELCKHDKIYLVGNSFGGLLNIAFALKYPEKVEGIVLVDSLVQDKDFAKDMKTTLELQGQKRDSMIADSFKDWMGRHSEKKRNKLTKTASSLVYETDFIKDIETSHVISTEQIKSIKTPVLAIYGENSNVRTKGELLAKSLPNCKLSIYPGCTHSVIWEDTEKLCQEIIKWIKGN